MVIFSIYILNPQKLQLTLFLLPQTAQSVLFPLFSDNYKFSTLILVKLLVIVSNFIARFSNSFFKRSSFKLCPFKFCPTFVYYRFWHSINNTYVTFEIFLNVDYWALRSIRCLCWYLMSSMVNTFFAIIME